MEEGFYVVWNPQGRNPMVRHDMMDVAQAEAERLARNNPGQSFYVLLAVSQSLKTDVHVRMLRVPDGVPF